MSTQKQNHQNCFVGNNFQQFLKDLRFASDMLFFLKIHFNVMLLPNYCKLLTKIMVDLFHGKYFSLNCCSQLKPAENYPFVFHYRNNMKVNLVVI